MQRVKQRIPLLARARRTTLISGPTGTGKEVVAARLHAANCEPAAPYIAVHCGALPEQLVEAELFGHTRGAFTGAAQSRRGLIPSATGGTLFLDEVDSLSPAVQAKLLRFLETGEFRAVGSDKIEHAEVWVLAATNRDLKTRVSEGYFRQDLLFRLDVMQLRMPPLRVRGGDVELLAKHFLTAVSGGSKSLNASAIAALYAYEWPGNVRELKHRIERAALLSEGRFISAEDLELGLPADHPDVAPEGVREILWDLVEREGLSLSEALAQCEKVLIEAALDAEQDNRTRAARRLGIHVRTIFKKLRR